jgi:hypothetical protein
MSAKKVLVDLAPKVGLEPTTLRFDSWKLAPFIIGHYCLMLLSFSGLPGNLHMAEIVQITPPFVRSILTKVPTVFPIRCLHLV